MFVIPKCPKKSMFSGKKAFSFCASACYLLVLGFFCLGFTLEPGKKLFENEQYPSAVKYFSQVLEKQPNNSWANFYMGRSLLALEKPAEALLYLQKAVALSPENADLHFWLGVAYWGVLEFDKERQSYERALELNPDHFPAMVYLGHNYLDRGDWILALQQYEKTLRIDNTCSQALFNRALAYKNLKSREKEVLAWKDYLALYRNGMWAIRAAEHLNDAGDFSYRSHILGVRKIVLRKLVFKNSEAEIEPSSNASMDRVGEILKNNPNLRVHIVVYKNNDQKLAKARSKWIKTYISKKFQIASKRLKTSWFGISERGVSIGQMNYSLHESVRFITGTGLNQ